MASAIMMIGGAVVVHWHSLGVIFCFLKWGMMMLKKRERHDKAVE